MVKKTLKNYILMRHQRKPKIRMVVKIDTYTKWSEVKAIEIEVSITDKIISYTIINGGSGLNIMSFQPIKKLELNATYPSPFVIKIANQSPFISVDKIKNYKTWIEREKNTLKYHAIWMHM